MNRRTFLQASGLLVASAMAGKAYGEQTTHLLDDAASSSTEGQNFPLMDLHVHRSAQLTIDDIVAVSKRLNMKIGVMHNIAPWGITNNEQLKEYIDAVKSYPVFMGLQPMKPGWTANLDPDLYSKADYIIMDPQVVEEGNGYSEDLKIWEYATYIDSAEGFMKRNMEHYLEILTGKEPLDVFACPLFLPPSIQREYNTLWTKSRLLQIVDAAVAKKVAIEINDLAHVPHEEFIHMCRRAGLKFTFGSDSRNQFVGRLDYCKSIARRCGLTEKDFYIPRRKERV